MDAAAALADLTEISPQVEAAVLLEADGAVLASTLGDEEAGNRLARTALDLLEAAPAALGGEQRTLEQLEVALPVGSVFVAREAGRGIVATTGPSPTSGLVLYDLRACLRSLDPPAPPKRTRARKPKPKPEPEQTGDA
jgi:predicted regulator of Ras-like GTPase activity (Roadblock/LC7/MglB family)